MPVESVVVISFMVALVAFGGGMSFWEYVSRPSAPKPNPLGEIPIRRWCIHEGCRYVELLNGRVYYSREPASVARNPLEVGQTVAWYSPHEGAALDKNTSSVLTHFFSFALPAVRASVHTGAEQLGLIPAKVPSLAKDA